MQPSQQGRNAPVISADEVRRVAELAHLALSDDETAAMQRDLSSILALVAKLNEVDTSSVEATTHAVSLPTALRDDTVSAGLPLDVAMRNAPERIGDGFGVPKIIE